MKWLVFADWRQVYARIAFKRTRIYYSAYGTFNKHRERIQKFRETGNLKHIYKNELGKTCFSHDAACSDHKYLAKRTVSGKTVKDKAYEIARNPKYDGYQR